MKLMCGALLLGASIVSAAAEEPRRWILDRETAVRLMYATPDSDDVVFSITCARRRMSIMHLSGSEQLARRRGTRLKLEAPGLALQYNARVAASETDGGYIVEVSITPDPKMFLLLGAGGEIAIEAQGSREQIPAPELELVQELERACIRR